MQFVFRRDEEGRERIYVGDVCVIATNPLTGALVPVNTVQGVEPRHIVDAVERADEAGFWERRMSRNPFVAPFFRRDEITVDVPVTDIAVQSVTRVSEKEGA